MCLSTTEDNRVAVFQLASHVLEAAAFTSPVEATAPSGSQAMVQQVQFSPGESIYDACWFPQMQAHDPQVRYLALVAAVGGLIVSVVASGYCVCLQTECFITSCRDHPIQLWDASTGTLRASYR